MGNIQRKLKKIVPQLLFSEEHKVGYLCSLRLYAMCWNALGPSTATFTTIKVKSAYEPSGSSHDLAGAYPSFCSMKRLGIFLLLPRCYATILDRIKRNN